MTISVSDPEPENLRFFEIKGELSFGPPTTGEITTRVDASAYVEEGRVILNVRNYSRQEERKKRRAFEQTIIVI